MILDNEDILIENSINNSKILNQFLNYIHHVEINHKKILDLKEDVQKDEIMTLLKYINDDEEYEWYIYDLRKAYRPSFMLFDKESREYILTISFFDYQRFHEIQPYIMFNSLLLNNWYYKDEFNALKNKIIEKLDLKKKGENIYVAR